jgi:hypothetical protein
LFTRTTLEILHTFSMTCKACVTCAIGSMTSFHDPESAFKSIKRE